MTSDKSHKNSGEENSSSPITSELLKKVRLLELRTRLQVRDVFGGRYQSIFKGQGMDFDEVREYFPGDDVRSIDWNVSARMDSPYVKIYREERELTVLLVVDVSASGEFGTHTSLKREIAAEMTALFALCALTNNDKVGLILFSDKVEHFVAPKKGRRHVLRMIRDVLAFKPESKGTSVSVAMKYALHAMRKRSVVFLMSDFMDEDYQNVVRVASRKHDLVALELYDPRERELPNAGLVPLRDKESGEVVWTDTSSKSIRQKYSEEMTRQTHERDLFFKQISVDRIELPMDKPYFMELVKFFRTREKRR